MLILSRYNYLFYVPLIILQKINNGTNNPIVRNGTGSIISNRVSGAHVWTQAREYEINWKKGGILNSYSLFYSCAVLTLSQ